MVANVFALVTVGSIRGLGGDIMARMNQVRLEVSRSTAESIVWMDSRWEVDRK